MHPTLKLYQKKGKNLVQKSTISWTISVRIYHNDQNNHKKYHLVLKKIQIKNKLSFQRSKYHSSQKQDNFPVRKKADPFSWSPINPPQTESKFLHKKSHLPYSKRLPCKPLVVEVSMTRMRVFMMFSITISIMPARISQSSRHYTHRHHNYQKSQSDFLPTHCLTSFSLH